MLLSTCLCTLCRPTQTLFFIMFKDVTHIAVIICSNLPGDSNPGRCASLLGDKPDRYIRYRLYIYGAITNNINTKIIINHDSEQTKSRLWQKLPKSRPWGCQWCSSYGSSNIQIYFVLNIQYNSNKDTHILCKQRNGQIKATVTALSGKALDYS